MINAAIFFLKYQGQKATPKQIERLLKTVGPNIIRMAIARGYKPEEQPNV